MSTQKISRDDAIELVQRASDGIVTEAAQQRLVDAVLTHNDGRVRRYLAKAAHARTSAYALDATSDEHGLRLGVWARELHRALDESHPIDSPAYRRHG